MTSPARAPRPTTRRAAPAPTRRPDLRVVEADRPGGRGRRRGPSIGVRVFAGTIAVFTTLLVAAVLHGFVVSDQAQLNEMQDQLVRERAALAREKVELAELRSPTRLAEAAEALGMVRPDEQVWLSPVEGSDPVVTGREAADPATDPTTDPATDPTTSELAGGDGGATAE